MIANGILCPPSIGRLEDAIICRESCASPRPSSKRKVKREWSEVRSVLLRWLMAAAYSGHARMAMSRSNPPFISDLGLGLPEALPRCIEPLSDYRRDGMNEMAMIGGRQCL